MKYINHFILTATFFLVFTFPLQITCQPELEQQIESGLFDFEPEMSDMEVEFEPQITRSTKDETALVLTIIRADQAVSNPLYLRSNPLGKRDLVDLPIFQNFSTFAPLQQVAALPFYTQTYKNYFFKDYENIDRYIELKQEHILKKINEQLIKQDLDPVSTFNLDSVLSLFAPIKAQERRVGFMLEYGKTTHNWSFSIKAPLNYIEHNFFLTRSEQQNMEKEPFFANRQGDVMEFALQHLVSDYLGLGNTRITFEHLVKKSDKYRLSIGGKITLPTLFRLGKGIIGSHFDVHKKAHDFNIYEDLLKIPDDLFDVAHDDQEAMNSKIEPFGIAVLDRLSTIVLAQNNQNNHHFGFGVFGNSTLQFKENVYLSTLSSVEFFTPAPEKRFFIIKHDPAAFSEFDWTDANQKVNEKITFLSAQIKEKFFPPTYETFVLPGITLQSTSALTYESQKWNFVLGSDFWWKTKEHFLSIKAPSDIKDLLETEKARRGYMYQTGLWIAAERHPFPNSEWQFGMRLGTTGLSSGIGQDVSFAFHIENFF